MQPTCVVLDTNVVFSALKSGSGASALVVDLLIEGAIEVCVSELLWEEYCGVLRRSEAILGCQSETIEAYLALLGVLVCPQEVYFRWRPTLRDAADDKVLECAVAGSVEFLVTFNTRDFAGSETFAPRVVTPGQFLEILAAQSAPQKELENESLEDKS